MKGLNEIIAIILILMIVIALACLAYTWFTGIFKMLTEPPSNVAVASLSVRSADVISFMKYHGCDSLFLWDDGTLHCMRDDCKPDGYCKYVYINIKE